MPRPVRENVAAIWLPTSAGIRSRLAAANLFASAAAAAAEARGAARIAISGGTTPKAMFALLADRTQPYFARIPWSKLHLFWVDERSVQPTDSESNYRMTNEAMLSKVPLPAAQVHRMEGELDPQTAASNYEALSSAFRARALKRRSSTSSSSAWATMATPPRSSHTPRPCTKSPASSSPTTSAQVNTWRITLTQPVINRALAVAFLIEGAVTKAEPSSTTCSSAPTIPKPTPRNSSGPTTATTRSSSTPQQPQSFPGQPGAPSSSLNTQAERLKAFFRWRRGLIRAANGMMEARHQPMRATFGTR